MRAHLSTPLVGDYYQESGSVKGKAVDRRQVAEGLAQEPELPAQVLLVPDAVRRRKPERGLADVLQEVSGHRWPGQQRSTLGHVLLRRRRSAEQGPNGGSARIGREGAHLEAALEQKFRRRGAELFLHVPEGLLMSGTYDQNGRKRSKEERKFAELS